MNKVLLIGLAVVVLGAAGYVVQVRGKVMWL